MGRRRGRRPNDHLDPTTARIAIIGSGLAGLSTAIGLQQAGFIHLVVYERDASFEARKDGYGMTLTYNPQGILGPQNLGVLEALATADCPSRAHYLLQGGHGHVLGYFGNEFSRNRGVGQRGNLRVPRQEVRRILLKRLGNDVVCWDCCLEKLTFRNDDDDDDNDNDSQQSPPVTLHFANGQTEYADLVVAADGWKSPTLQSALRQNHCQFDGPAAAPIPPKPKSLGIYIIVGLARGVDHALVRECGFYTLGRRKRLFVMPYSGTTLDDIDSRQTMWQLSFAHAPTTRSSSNYSHHDHDSQSYIRTPIEYMQQARDIMQGWHAPVPQLLDATPQSTVWGTLLHDCDPWAIWKALKKQQSTISSRFLVVGDALHAMSPFKGQGANQALADGAVVAKWLAKPSRLRAAVQGAMREMVQRTAPVVQASREAAQYWHATDAWIDAANEHSFAGLSTGKNDAVWPIAELQRALRQANISASSVNDLDVVIGQFVREKYPQKMLKQQEYQEKSSSPLVFAPSLVAQALHAAQQGDSETLRLLTWEEHYRLVQCAVDVESGNSCLHQALLPASSDGKEHYWTSHRQRLVTWLVTEAGCDLEQCNLQGQQPEDIARTLMDGAEMPEWWQRLQNWKQRSNAKKAAILSMWSVT